MGSFFTRLRSRISSTNRAIIASGWPSLKKAVGWLRIPALLLGYLGSVILTVYIAGFLYQLFPTNWTEEPINRLAALLIPQALIVFLISFITSHLYGEIMKKSAKLHALISAPLLGLMGVSALMLALCPLWLITPTSSKQIAARWIVSARDSAVGMWEKSVNSMEETAKAAVEMGEELEKEAARDATPPPPPSDGASI